MLVNIDTRSGVPIYRQVFDQVKGLILTGQLASGSQVPSVRDLAASLKVNPMTVSKAYSMLAREDLLENRRGVGLFVVGLTDREHRRHSIRLLEDAVKNAALSAVQLGVSKKEALDLFAKFHDRFNSKGRGK